MILPWDISSVIASCIRVHIILGMLCLIGGAEFDNYTILLDRDIACILLRIRVVNRKPRQKIGWKMEILEL